MMSDAKQLAKEVFDAIVGEITCLGWISDDPFDNPNNFSVTVQAGEFMRVVAAAISKGRSDLEAQMVERASTGPMCGPCLIHRHSACERPADAGCGCPECRVAKTGRL